MKKLFVLFSLLTLLANNEAKCDNVVINGDTFWIIFFSPFDNYPGIVKLREQLNDYRTNCTEDNCSFLSTWEIINNRLMLVKIENCQCNEKKQTASLKTLFGDQLQNGMLCADWYTGEIWITKDKPNSWRGMFAASWPTETQLIVKKGIVISVKNFVYPKPIEKDYNINPYLLNNFIYTHINWDKFHNLPEYSKRSYFRFDQDANGYLINIKQDENSPSHETFDKDEMKEIGRVTGLLQWPLYYYHGQPLKSFTGISFILSKEMQKKFTKPD